MVYCNPVPNFFTGEVGTAAWPGVRATQQEGGGPHSCGDGGTGARGRGLTTVAPGSRRVRRRGTRRGRAASWPGVGGLRRARCDSVGPAVVAQSVATAQAAAAGAR